MSQALARMTPTIAALRAIADHMDGDTIFVSGDDSIWKFSAASVAVDDGALVVKPANIGPAGHPGRWLSSIKASPGSVVNSVGTGLRQSGNTISARQRFKITFPGDLNTTENDLIPIDVLEDDVDVDNLVVALDGTDLVNFPAPSGADVHVDFYKVVLATGVKTLIGQVVVAAGALRGVLPVAPAVTIAGLTEGVKIFITQKGSVNPGHSATCLALGG